MDVELSKELEWSIYNMITCTKDEFPDAELDFKSIRADIEKMVACNETAPGEYHYANPVDRRDGLVFKAIVNPFSGKTVCGIKAEPIYELLGIDLRYQTDEECQRFNRFLPESLKTLMDCLDFEISKTDVQWNGQVFVNLKGETPGGSFIKHKLQFDLNTENMLDLGTWEKKIKEEHQSFSVSEQVSDICFDNDANTYYLEGLIDSDVCAYKCDVLGKFAEGLSEAVAEVSRRCAANVDLENTPKGITEQVENVAESMSFSKDIRTLNVEVVDR